jgi:hypothetical protein
MTRKKKSPSFLQRSFGIIWLVVVGVASSGLTLVASSYVNFINHNRAVIEADYSDLKKSASAFFQLLDSYSLRARTGAEVDDQTRAQFRATALRLYNEAANIAKREPRVKTEFTNYAERLLALQQIANEFKGPTDAKKFVEATSEYLNAEERFTHKVSGLQRSFIKSIYSSE